MSETARVFVGTDRSQWIGVQVLEYSIRKHSSIPVEVHPMVDLGLPEPSDPRQSQRTGFSFSRFAIPQLAGYQGKAVYLDADMMVFKDFAGLWNIPVNDAKVVIQDSIPDELAHADKKGAPDTRIKQCAVMLLDCSRLDWDPRAIIAGLGNGYTYEDLVYELCILAPEEIKYRVPYQWNSLEHYDSETCLLHYTDMYTQPWVAAENQNGYLWIGYLNEMLTSGVISRSQIEQEISLGYARPSLLVELTELCGSRCPTAKEIKRLQEIDDKATFVRHQAVYEAKKRRSVAIKEYQRQMADAGIATPGATKISRGVLRRLFSSLLR
jgi:lipopolysaccharide biosynthesis glycosyltransferase